MAGLPREIYKWLSSLDLSFTVKTPRRDFSNGFLIAEILSRFYPTDIYMHSFDYGSASKRKTDNWQQLEKFFKKREIPFERALLDDMIDAKEGAANQFLQQLYTFLTKRKVHVTQPPAPEAAAEEPSPTATYKATRTISQPASSLPMSRTSNQQAGPRVAHPVAPETVIPTVQFKGVAVKPADKPAAQLRASKAESIAARSQRSSEQLIGGSIRSVTDILNASVSGQIKGESAKALDPRRDAIAAFGDALRNLQPELVGAVFNDIQAKLNTIADSCAASNQEFWKFWTALLPCIASPVTVALVPAVDVVCAVGRRICEHDSDLAWNLLDNEYALPRLATVITSYPGRASTILRVLFSYTARTSVAHAHALERLQEALRSPSQFLRCVANTIWMEDDIFAQDREETKDLLDLYKYYGLSGLSCAAPRDRAAGAAILGALAYQTPDIVLALPQLPALAADSWWEVRAQAAVIACGLLRFSTEAAAEPADLLEIVRSALSPNESVHVIRVAIAASAAVLRTQSSLVEPFVNALVSLTAEDRAALFAENTSPVSPTAGDVSGNYDALSHPIQENWESLEVASCIATYVASTQPDNLSAGELHVLAVAASTGDATDAKAWAGIFNQLKPYIYVALCDDECISYVISALTAFFVGIPKEAIDSLGTLLSTLKILYPSGPVACQDEVAQFLLELVSATGPVSQAVADMVRQFPPELRKSRLGPVVDRVGK
eukprot:TRINITY_DN3086_c0_g1_i1.p1 TRINITY_DN3086_c0_g1~~TRINITY_DN3086_c0_g1_i1.p1  ORF type:complete len:723 (-),score=169.73 TRINITY_DN3086_c0_g1_i1:50-2218(-)